MRPLPKPAFAPVDVYKACAKRVRNREKRRALLAASNAVATAANLYDAAGQAGCLYQITTPQASISGLAPEDLVGRYTSGLVRSRVGGVYEALLTATHRCPLCVQRDVSTLDHYLPKTAFPAFAVLPQNLVPCCVDCNIAKGERRPVSAQQQTFHPYFDDFGTERWLYGSVIERFPAAVRFEVRPPPQWGNVKINRTRHHFTVFGLGSLYASQAVDELQNIRLICEELFKAGGPPAVRSELERRARSSAAFYINSWQSAAYSALAGSDWYCEGGFAAPAPSAAWQ